MFMCVLNGICALIALLVYAWPGGQESWLALGIFCCYTSLLNAIIAGGNYDA